MSIRRVTVAYTDSEPPDPEGRRMTMPHESNPPMPAPEPKPDPATVPLSNAAPEAHTKPYTQV